MQRYTIASALFNARSTYRTAAEAGDYQRMLRYIRAGEIGARIGSVFIAAILFCVAAWMFDTAGKSAQESLWTAPEAPELGQPSMHALVDETGYTGAYAAEEIPKIIEGIAEDYGLRVALCSSFIPATDRYTEFFSDERGVLIYLQEHGEPDASSKAGVVSYFWGNELDGIFTEEVVARLNSHQSYLENSTRDRAINVMYDFRDGLRDVFEDKSNESLTAGIEFVVGVFWIILGLLALAFFPSLCLLLMGLPPKKKDRELLKASLLKNSSLVL